MSSLKQASTSGRGRRRFKRRVDVRWRLITESQAEKIDGLSRVTGLPMIGGGMDRGGADDSLSASCQDRSAPGESYDHVDHGFSTRGRTHRPRHTVLLRFHDRSHHQAVHRGRAAPGLGGLGEPSAKPQDWDRGCGRLNHAIAGLRHWPDFRRTGRAAKGLRKVRCCPRRRERETRRHDRRRGVQGHQLRRSNRAESVKVGDLDRRGQLEVPSGRSRLAGHAPPIEPSWGRLFRWRLRNRTPQRRANASASAWSRTPRRAARSSFLRSCWKSVLRRRYSQAKPGASSDRSSSYAPGVRQSARLIGVVSTGKWPISRPAGMISARAAGQYAPAPQRVLPWWQGTGSRLVWRAPAQQMLIAVLCHPAGSRQVRVPGPARSIGLAHRIDMEDDPSNFSPVSPFRVRIEQTQIRHEMLFVVAREDAGARSGVGNGRVKRWRLHSSVPTKSNTFPLRYGCPRSSRDA